MAKNLQNILVVASSTLGSRVLGLARDALTVAFLGLGAVSSSFVFAFTVPNLFRRLLGEGALSSAFIPIFAESIEQEGREAAFRFANVVLSWLAAVTGVLVGLGAVLFAGLGWMLENSAWGADFARSNPELYAQWDLGFVLGAALMPYLSMVCLAAIFGAILNVLHRFAVPALTPVLLNLAMIGGLLLGGKWLGLDPRGIVWVLSAGVLVGGALQLLVPAVVLWGMGWRPQLRFVVSKKLRRVFALFLPGVAGAAIMQVNTLVSRLLAFGLNTSAVAALYFANRLVELPLGVFAIAITTVIFPTLSRLAAQGDALGMRRAYEQGIRLILAITVPAAVGLVVLREAIIGLLFEWGAFSGADTQVAAPLLFAYALALPFYALATYAVRGFHALQDTRTPVWAALVAFAVNLVGSLILMQSLGALGLALANVFSAAVQALLLTHWLKLKKPELGGIRLAGCVGKIAGAALVMGVFAAMGQWFCDSLVEVGKLQDAAVVGFVIPLAVAVYFGVLFILRFEERDAVLRILRRRNPVPRVGGKR